MGDNRPHSMPNYQKLAEALVQTTKRNRKQGVPSARGSPVKYVSYVPSLGSRVRIVACMRLSSLSLHWHCIALTERHKHRRGQLLSRLKEFASRPRRTSGAFDTTRDWSETTTTTTTTSGFDQWQSMDDGMDPFPASARFVPSPSSRRMRSRPENLLPPSPSAACPSIYVDCNAWGRLHQFVWPFLDGGKEAYFSTQSLPTCLLPHLVVCKSKVIVAARCLICLALSCRPSRR
ncbi:hypothetical protein LZ32DRAFT_124202 [Colletotrichum eremochloae]|nr:hypothetical protein LZ32DRAFT_124202 [Colletotrichum eremochloae]